MIDLNRFVPGSSPHRGGHTFHIPVMGTGFTVDTPLKVARYGISSVVSIVDDNLAENVRKHHSDLQGEPFEPIEEREEDSRARRITAYLNFLQRAVQKQVEQLKASPFEHGSEITRYYNLLPEGPLKDLYYRMSASEDKSTRHALQTQLRSLAEPGSIDVNIMTKVDRDHFKNGIKLPSEFSDALSSLRGFARSDLSSSVVLSAGLNQRLYGYIAQFDDFFPNTEGILKKKIVIKVSDFRSAEIQGKFLAKKGIWVSEYRIESGLNCGGHAFATKGLLMGPILEDFKNKREQLTQDLCAIYNKALVTLKKNPVEQPFETRITVQGGIGTASEHSFLMRYYEVDSAGWATPFLLVPEVVNVDPEHLQKLCEAGEEDVYLSDSSPLGVPFWNLRTSASEQDREKLIEEGHPGSPCPRKYLVSNTEFTSVPICLASQTYVKKKMRSLESEPAPGSHLQKLREYVLGKSCLCRDLAGAFERITGITPNATPAICCGPNIINFNKIASLEEMVEHIYGRLSLLSNPDRPHMFIKELRLYIDFLHKELDKHIDGLSSHTPNYFQEFKEGLRSGIEYYRNLVDRLELSEQPSFLEKLTVLAQELEWIPSTEAVAPA